MGEFTVKKKVKCLLSATEYSRNVFLFSWVGGWEWLRLEVWGEGESGLKLKGSMKRK